MMEGLLSAITEFAKAAQTPAMQGLVNNLVRLLSDHGIEQTKLDAIIKSLPAPKPPKKRS